NKMAGVKRKLSPESDPNALHKVLDEVTCPVCMDHPHNAVLLLCTSHDKGCRSYICDTSYRHSNCLDRFKKLHSEPPTDPNPEPNSASRANINEPQSTFHRVPGNQVAVRDSESLRRSGVGEETTNLKCPLCRGTVLGFKVVEEVRSYLDMKNRSCSRESCSFTGNYQDLRRHARRIHPTSRPSDTDPTRERAWRRLENQREYGDIVSAIRSAMPGAVVVGDYVIENGDRIPGEREAGNGGGGNSSSDIWTTFVLFQMIGSLENNGGSSGSGSGGGGSRSHRIYWVYKMKTMMMMMVKGCVYKTKQVMVPIMFQEEDEGLVVQDQAETIRDKAIVLVLSLGSEPDRCKGKGFAEIPREP
ncbi:hypothetical protein HID58_074866, partial [Brassica napus]